MCIRDSTKGAVGNALNNLDDKAASAQNATYNALKNDAVPGIDQFGPVDIPEPPIDPGTTDAPIVDSTPSAEEIGSPIQEPPLQTEGAEPPIQDSTHPTGGCLLYTSLQAFVSRKKTNLTN